MRVCEELIARVPGAVRAQREDGQPVRIEDHACVVRDVVELEHASFADIRPGWGDAKGAQHGDRADGERPRDEDGGRHREPIAREVDDGRHCFQHWSEKNHRVNKVKDRIFRKQLDPRMRNASWWSTPSHGWITIDSYFSVMSRRHKRILHL